MGADGAAPRLPRVPLARRAREPDRLGRALDCAPARGPGRWPRRDRADAARADPASLAHLEEPVVAADEAEAVAYLARGVVPASDWSRRVLDAHEEGYAAVGGSVDAGGGLLRRPPRELAPYAPGSGRIPAFAHPLVCPSLVRGIEPEWEDEVAGLPALRPPAGEPWLYDGRIEVRAPPRSGRPRG